MTYRNPKKLEFGSYRVGSITVNGETKTVSEGEEAVIGLGEVECFGDGVTEITIELL